MEEESCDVSSSVARVVGSKSNIKHEKSAPINYDDRVRLDILFKINKIL